MGVFTKMISALAGQGGVRESVRQSLRAAQKERTKIMLEVSTGKQPMMMFTTIEQVADDSVIISQPIVGGHTYPLAFGEQVKMSFVSQAINHAGQSKCLGRTKIEASGQGGSHTIFAYRLSLPESLAFTDRRRNPRVQLRFSAEIEAQLYAPASAHGPVLGTVMDISMTGARIRTNMPAGRIVVGQTMFLKSLMPDPVGLMDELVDVRRVEIETRTGLHNIGISFRKKINGLEDLIRAAQAVPEREKSAA